MQGVTGAVKAHGLIAAPDACDDLGARLETNDDGLTLRVIVRGSRSHPGGCGQPGEFALVQVQWQARIEPVEAGVSGPTPRATRLGSATRTRTGWWRSEFSR